jgi:hypothetical protein
MPTPPHCLARDAHWLLMHRMRSVWPASRRAVRRYTPLSHEMTMTASGSKRASSACSSVSSGAADQARASMARVTSSWLNGASGRTVRW